MSVNYHWKSFHVPYKVIKLYDSVHEFTQINVTFRYLTRFLQLGNKKILSPKEDY